MMIRVLSALGLVLLVTAILGSGWVLARGSGVPPPVLQVASETAFTYQGRLKDNDGPVGGPCDFQFGLFGAGSGGAQLGTDARSNMSVRSGLFVAPVDFGRVAGGGDQLQSRRLEGKRDVNRAA